MEGAARPRVHRDQPLCGPDRLSSSSDTVRLPVTDRSSAVAPAPSAERRCPSRRTVHHIAAERADMAGRRRADKRRRIGDRGVRPDDDRIGHQLGVRHQGADPHPGAVEFDTAQFVDAIDGDEISRECRLAVPCPTTRSVPPAIGRAPAPRATSASSTVVAMVKLTTTSLRSSSRPVRRSSAAGARACPPASQHRWRSLRRSGRSGPRPDPWPRTVLRSDPGSR